MSTFAEYLDLHINLEDIPDYNSIEAEFSTEENFNKFAARFILKLQQFLSSNNKQYLLRLYEGDFSWGVKKYPANLWVEGHIIEEECDLQFNLVTHSIYNELVYRIQFAQRQQSGSIADIASKSWTNYVSLFEDVNEGNRKINLPEGWICDIIDNFISQFEGVHEWKNKQTDKTASIQNWTFEEIEKQLQGFYSKMIINGKLKLPEEASTVDFFGYFSIVYHLKLKTLQGKFSQALNLIQIICLDHTIIYSKSFLSQMNLFYYASFSYFMIEKYMQSVKLAETIGIFFESYKAFIKESLNEKALVQINEKVLALWCLANIFQGNQPHDLILGILNDQNIVTKERNYDEPLIDKYQKLSQFDNNTFLELFNFAAPKIIDDKAGTITNNQGAEQKFEDLKKINLNTILKLYTRIEVAKMARFLNYNEEKLQQTLKQYGKSKASLMQTPWEKTILKSLLKFEGEFTVQVKDNIVYIAKEAERKDGKDYSYLLNGINDIAKNLAKI